MEIYDTLAKKNNHMCNGVTNIRRKNKHKLKVPSLMIWGDKRYYMEVGIIYLVGMTSSLAVYPKILLLLL